MTYATEFRTNHDYFNDGRGQIYIVWIPFKGVMPLRRLVKICQLIKNLLGAGWHTDSVKSLSFLTKWTKPKTMSHFLFGKRHCGLEYSRSVLVSGSQAVFPGTQKFRWGLLWCSSRKFDMNVGIESVFSTKALYTRMKYDSFIRSFVKMLFVPSGWTADNYILKDFPLCLYCCQVWKCS